VLWLQQHDHPTVAAIYWRCYQQCRLAIVRRDRLGRFGVAR
jgi:hypothetical protein